MWLFVMPFPVQQQGFHDLPAIGVGDCLERGSAAQGRNLLVDPGLDLLLHLSRNLSHQLWINGRIVRLDLPRHLLFKAIPLFEHLLRRLRGGAEMRCVKAKPLLNFLANLFGAICRIHFHSQ